MERKPFSGAMTAIVTPFRADSSIDSDSFLKILKSQKDAGIHGVVVSGTTGESPTLTLGEKLTLLELALQLQDDHFSVYIGAGTNSTASTLAEAKEFTSFRSKGKKISGLMAVVPYYNKPNQAGLSRHFAELAQNLQEIPLCLYNVPGRTACHLFPETFASLASRFQNIIATKEAAGDVCAMTRLGIELQKAGVTRKIEILSGDDATFPAALITGARGVISVTSHLIPRTIVALLKAAESGDFERLKVLNFAAFSLAQGIFCAPNPAPVKYALSLYGLCEAHVRGPLVGLSESEMNIVKQSLQESEKYGAVIL